MTDNKISSRPFIDKLVAFDTTSHLSNLDLIHYISDYLSEHGVESQLVFNNEQTKANLYATIGPQNKPGVMLSGHTDVVPVSGQDWHTDPFTVVEKDAALYGRGTADMKSFIAVILANVPQLVKSKLDIPVHLAFSYDEEIGCVGVRRLLDMMEGMTVKPAMCIVGEPTSMQVVNAHKGKLSQRVRVNGLEAHSGLPHLGVNAVDYAAKLIVFIRSLAQELEKNGPYEDGFEVRHTTIHTGLISGGTALNIVPNLCELEFEIRNIPGQEPGPLLQQIIEHAKNELEPEMKNVADHCGFEFESLPSYPGMFTAPDAAVISFVRALIDNDNLSKITFGTEGGLFTERLDIPTVVCGPGNIKQAHKPDEFISLGQIALMENFMSRLIDALKE